MFMNDSSVLLSFFSSSSLVFSQQGVSSGPAGGPAKKRLRIGYYLSDDFFEAAPACQRAVLEAKEALERAGHELVLFDVFGGNGPRDVADGASPLAYAEEFVKIYYGTTPHISFHSEA